MRIDHTHRPWFVVTLIAAAVATVVYILYAVNTPTGPRGGSALGLTFGILGYGLMLYAGLIGARKKVPTWRIGRGQTWMRGHIWLGTLSLLIILFHAGFAFRGPLTTALMILFFLVIASGIAGAALQHFVPSVMTQRVPMETIYEEIPHVRVQLCEEADKLVASICGPMDADDTEEPAAAVTTLVEIEQGDKARFREIYLQQVRPYLADPEARQADLADPLRSTQIFESMRRLLGGQLHGVLDDLENICEEEHQLSRQIRIYRWLHAWLLVHVPLSIALLVLGAIHAVMALRY